MEELTVTQHNNLIEARYKLSLDEQRLILACIAQVDSRKPLPKDHIFRVSVTEFAGLYNIAVDSAYSQMREAMERLYARTIHISGEARECRWISEKAERVTEGYVELEFGRRVSRYLSMLHKEFTSYKLKRIASFKSVHTIRLYELLMQFKEVGERFITLEQFKQCLGTPDSYPRFVDFKRWVLEPAIKEINAKSDLSVRYEVCRKNKAVVSLNFYFTCKRDSHEQ